MRKNSFSKKQWIDLVFEDRNKSYGAYQLRSQSGNIMLKALFIGIIMVVCLISIPVIARHFDNPVVAVENNDEEINDDKQIKVISIDDLFKKEEEKVVEKTESPKNKKEEKSAEDQKKFVSTIITKAETTDEDLASEDDYQDVNTGVTDIEGNQDGIIGSESPSDRNEDGDNRGIIKTDEDGASSVLKGFELDKMPEFPGGMNNFLKTVKNNFRVPEIFGTTSVTVYVSFVIEPDGSISEIQILKDPGYGLAKEAIRTLQRINTRWKPGIKNGKPVRTSFTLPIKVELK